MLKTFFSAGLFILVFHLNAADMSMSGDTLPYYEIPDYPKEYSSATTAARVVDGLGFRYYWATESLLPEDLLYKPSDDSRTIRETAEHILGLATVVLNAVKGEENGRIDYNIYDFEGLRAKTLTTIAEASLLLKQSEPSQVNDMKMIFRRGENTNEFPFWNLLNGPLADAIYHTGQIVAFRRASGNPIRSGVSVLTGKVRE